MEKKIISEEIFYECKRASMFSKPYTWGEIKKMLEEEKINLLDDDIFLSGFEEGWDEGDSARDDMYFVKIRRERFETDEELEIRKKNLEKRIEESKNIRYEQYIKLKKEFEK